MSAVERLLIWSLGVHLAVRVGAPPLRGVGYAVRSPDSLLGLAIGLIRW
jgi:hypothetical protein